MRLSCNVVAITYCLRLSIFRDLRLIVLAVIVQISARRVEFCSNTKDIFINSSFYLHSGKVAELVMAPG